VSLEDAVNRMARLLEEVLERLKKIEDRLSSFPLSDEEARIAQHLVHLYSIPIGLAVEAAKRFMEVVSRARLDPISTEIIRVLSPCREMNISEITRSVKSARGKASRRIVREKLLKLEQRGIVVNTGHPNRPRYTLRSCRENRG